MLIPTDLEKAIDLSGRPIYINCTFSYPITNGIEEIESGKEYIKDDTEFSDKMIDFIQKSINMKLPSELIESILKAEDLFLQKYE